MKMVDSNDINIDKDQIQQGKTGLHVACSQGLVSVVRKLLDEGARADIKGDYGDTPLHDAAVKNYPKIVTQLLERSRTNNFPLDIQNNEGQTALDAACLKGCYDVVQILLDFGADTSIVDNEGDTAFYYAVKSRNSKVLEKLLVNLIKNKKNLDTRYRTGKTALHYACKYGLESIVKELLDQGVDVDMIDDNRNIALYYAVKNNHTAVVQLYTTALGCTG